MQTHSPNFWYKFNLYRREIIIIFLCIISGLAYSQSKSLPLQQEQYDRYKRKKEINLSRYDEKFLHYGFFLGLNYERSQIKLSDYYFTDSIYQSITSVGEGGFSLGFLLNVKLHDQLSFRVVPAVGFYNWSTKYTFTKDTLINGENRRENIQTIESAFIELQFLIKYRSIRRKNTRMYLIGGVKPSIRAGGKKGEASEQRLSMNRINLSLEYGAGLELYFPYFKWSPELRFSHGILNMTPGDNNIFNKPLLSSLTHTVTLYFFFE